MQENNRRNAENMSHFSADEREAIIIACETFEQYVRANDRHGLLKFSDQLEFGVGDYLYNDLNDESVRYVLANRSAFTQYWIDMDHFLHIAYIRTDWSDELVQEVLADYREDNFLAPAAMLVSFIKKDLVNDQQVKQIKIAADGNRSGKEILRWLGFREIRKLKISQGIQLERADIIRLLELRGFDLLNEAFDKGLIALDHLDLFPRPEPGAPRRKALSILHDKAFKLSRKGDNRSGNTHFL